MFALLFSMRNGPVEGQRLLTQETGENGWSSHGCQGNRIWVGLTLTRGRAERVDTYEQRRSLQKC